MEGSKEAERVGDGGQEDTEVIGKCARETPTCGEMSVRDACETHPAPPACIYHVPWSMSNLHRVVIL